MKHLIPATAPGRSNDTHTHSRREITSEELLRDGREVHIRHRGELYTLRQTNNGKLILTK